MALVGLLQVSREAELIGCPMSRPTVARVTFDICPNVKNLFIKKMKRNASRCGERAMPAAWATQ